MLKDYLIYNDEKHEYSIQYDPTRKIIIPSVTQLLEYGHLVDMGYVDPFYAESGTELHTMTELHDSGLYDDSLVVSRVHAAMVAYDLFKLDNEIEWHQSEQIVFHESLFYAGTKDRLGLVNGNRALVDVKSGHRYRWHVVQLAAYLMCEGESAEAADLYLGAGDYKYHVWPEDDVIDAANIFRMLAKLYWYNHPMDHKRLLKISKELAE